jgi:hypothetical protein
MLFIMLDGVVKGAMTFSITTLGIKTLSIMSLFATLSIMGLFATLSINGTRHK